MIKVFTPIITDSEDEVEVVAPVADILTLKDVWEHLHIKKLETKSYAEIQQKKSRHGSVLLKDVI